MEKPRISELLIGLLFPLFLIAILLFVFVERDLLREIFASPESFETWIENQPALPVVFMVLQFLQVVVFIIPGEIPQIAGGYLFGAPLGLLYSLTGIVAGSLLNFIIGRLLGSPFVRLVIGKERFDRFAHLLSSPRALTVFFLLFLFPGFPKDALCYAAGLSTLRFFPFFMISLFGRLPALTASVLAGSAAAREAWIFLIILSLLVALAAGLGYIYRARIHDWIEKVAHKSDD